eukprot:gene10875-12086_t
MATVKSVSTFWRQAGLSYLQYLNVCSRAVRNGLKEPAKSRALSRQFIFYNKSVKDSGKSPVVDFLPK